jgi:uncharacterized protein (TIGR02453 family)
LVVSGIVSRRREDVGMVFFTKDTLKFWRGLDADNSKTYFDANRRAYETHLKAPYQELAAALVTGLQAEEPEYQIDPRKATYRINRDIRFAKDKTPYKTALGITIGRSEKHDGTYPGYTCRVGVSGVAVAGGLYNPDTELRDKVRRFVGDNSAELRGLLAEPEFVETFGELGGEAHKRAPVAFKELAAVEPLVLNKQWVFWGNFDDPKLLLNDDLDHFILDKWDIAGPVMEFFKRAVR